MFFNFLFADSLKMEENDQRVTFIQQMPKIELHAHLSGSISKQTVRELISLHQKNYPDEEIPPKVINAFGYEDDANNATKDKQEECSKKDNKEENKSKIKIQ